MPIKSLTEERAGRVRVSFWRWVRVRVKVISVRGVQISLRHAYQESH
jgi:hypothetical protein